MPNKALLIVDVQNDFCPGGALAVRKGDFVVPVLNAYIDRFTARDLPIYASRDWHPADTRHFKERGGPWPPHCIQETEGAAFHADLKLPGTTTVLTKGTSTEDHGYSAFEGLTPGGKDLTAAMKDAGVRTVYVGGLTTDYCVRTTVLDGRCEGLDIVVLLDAVRGIDVEEGDIARALDEMMRAGARTATLATINMEI